MKKKRLLAVLMMSLAVSLVGCVGQGKAKDVAIGENAVEEVVVTDTPEEIADKNIIAGTLMSAELLDLFDITPVGVLTTEKGLPERYKDVPRIGMPMKPDLEIVASLEPEVYITDGNLKESLEETFKNIH